MVDVALSALGGAGWQFLDNSGRILAGGRLYTFEANSTTEAETYTSSSGNVSNGVYVQLDSAGRPSEEIWLDTSIAYKFVVKKFVSTGVYSDIRTYDNIPPIASSADLAAFEAELLSGAGAGLVGYDVTETYITDSIGAKFQNWVSVTDFGAVGDNTADDYSAFTQAINYCLNNNKKLYIPAPSAKYKVGSLITATLPNPAVGPDATNYIAQLVMHGDGFGSTQISCPTTGFLKVIGSSQQHSVDLQAFAVTCGTTGTMTAIEMDCSAYPFFGEWTAKSTINLHFHGNDGLNNVNYWGTCVDAIDWSNIDFSKSMFDGASTPAGRGVVTRKSAGDYACVFDFTNTHFRFLATGYEYGTGSQTANLTSCFFGMNVKDVYATAGGVNHQGLSITNCDCFELVTGPGVHIACDVPNFTFSGNRWAVGAASTAVVMDVTNQTNITNNQFFPDVTANTAVSAIDINGTISGSHCIVDHNNFASTTIGARLLADSENVHFGPHNICTGGMTLVTDAGTNNVIGSGYSIGWGGSVAQGSGAGKATPVTINAMSGNITMDGANLNANTEVAFVVNNSFALASDLPKVGIDNGNYAARTSDWDDGQFTIRIRNQTPGNLAETPLVRFQIDRNSSS